MIEEPRTEQIVLDRLRIAAQHRLSPYVLHNMELSTWTDPVMGDLVLRLQSDVLAKTLETREAFQTVTFEHPATTWQMFKHSHRDGRWLGWLARRWPVRMEATHKSARFEMQARLAFPDCSYVFPKELGRPVSFWTAEAKLS